jgi:hypothetical protein
MVMGKRQLDLVTGSTSSSSLASAVTCSGGLPSKARGRAAPGGFDNSPCPVDGA